MTVHVRYFAVLRERARRDDEIYNVPTGGSVAVLWEMVCHSLPQLQPFGDAIRFAVNQEYVDRSHVLRDGDEVALIPPVSGG